MYSIRMYYNAKKYTLKIMKWPMLDPLFSSPSLLYTRLGPWAADFGESELNMKWSWILKSFIDQSILYFYSEQILWLHDPIWSTLQQFRNQWTVVSHLSIHGLRTCLCSETPLQGFLVPMTKKFCTCTPSLRHQNLTYL